MNAIFGATNGFFSFLIKLISHIYYLLSPFLSAFGATNAILFNHTGIIAASNGICDRYNSISFESNGI